MAPKKEKKTEVVDENAWRTSIIEAPLDEENWKVKVILIESADNEHERNYLNKFEKYAAEGKRFVIKNICKTETMFMINQLGAERNVKDNNLRVFEEGQLYLKDKKDIPPDVLALVIKHLILKMKDEYLDISRQRLEIRHGMQSESATMIDRAEVKGTVTSRTQELAGAHALSESKGKVDTEPVSAVTEHSKDKKYNTLLRERGEEWRDKVYVDDFPTDGPNLYVTVTGFVEPYLPGCLVKVGIPLTAVVQVRIDHSTTSIPSSLLNAKKRGQSLPEFLTEKSTKFWEDLQLLRIQRDSADDFKNIAFIIFSPPYWDSEDLSGSPDKIYDELCFLIYDIQDLSRQHIHYLDNMHIIHIPEVPANEHYNKYYEQRIDKLPLECVTIYSVLDTILRTVCNCQRIEDETSRTSLSTAVTLNAPPKDITEENKLEDSENLVKEVFKTLCNTEDSKKTYRLTYGQEYEDLREPIVLDYGDFVKLRTFQLGNINLDNIVFSSLLGMPINNLWRNQSQPSGELEAKINFHVNILLSCFDRNDVETAELNRLLNILACRKLFNNRSSLKKRHLTSTTISEFKKNYLKRSILAEPLPQCLSLVTSGHTLSPSFPSMTKSENDYECPYSQSDPDPEVQRLKILFDCPDISDLVTAVEIENNEPNKQNMIDDFDFFEDLSGTCAFQVMREAFNKFNCVDYKYCEVTDCFILMFFNSHDSEGIAREEWRCHLPTPLCLQDFFDFILEEHYEWIQNEEKIYDEMILSKARSVSKVSIDPYALPSCVETTDVDMDLLMEGSLKYQEIIQVEDSAHEATTEPLTTNADLLAAMEIDSKHSKKTPKNTRYSYEGIAECRTSVELPAKPFLGYDFGDRRVEVFGKDAIFFSKDGTKITSMYTLYIPMNLEYIALNVLPGNSYNEVWVHKALGEYVNPGITDTCESFRIATKDHVMIYMKKQTYQMPLMAVSSIDIAPKTKKSTSKLVIEKVDYNISPIYETKYFHSLYVTWPNGMITETIYANNSPVISHIKQYHTCPVPHLDEEMRCISLNGEVIIFKPSGDIEVLKPDGTFIKINKCYKRLVSVIDPEPPIRDEGSDKSKKSKSKAKLSKGSSKTSKIGLIEEDKVSEEKSPEYELIIEEFDIIETSGVKQKWINDVSFDIEKLLIRTATDYCQGEVFSRRMDGTNILLNKDGLHIVTFPNKTRIITSYLIDNEEIYPEWTDLEIEYFEMFEPETLESGRSKASNSQKSFTGYTGSSRTSISNVVEEEETNEKPRTDGYIFVHIIYTVEHSNFSTITINNVDGKINIESPNKTVVVVDINNNYYDFTLDHQTTASFDGDNLNISYEACSECRSVTNCDIKIMPNIGKSASDRKVEQHGWLKMTDSFKKHVIVNEEGAMSLTDELSLSEKRTSVDTNETSNNFEEKEPDSKSESSVVSHGKCREMYLAKNVRFFILRRELNCSELLHHALLEQYERACRWKPWCSINEYDTFGDHRSLVSILTPIHATEPEKWLMESKQAGKPKFLTYKDLKKDSGKGFYRWMRPYERFTAQPNRPENVLPERLPKAYILRTLEKEWSEEKREELKGAKELIRAVLRYRCIMEADSETILSIPIIDPRPEEERKIDDVIQALAHRIYEDLKVRLANDVQTRMKTTITTKPPVEPEDMSVEGEFEEEDETKIIEEERESLVNEAEAGEQMSPALQRYWRRRAEEYKEEQFYKYLLRDGNVPPYFRNVLGGAIWWEVNNVAGEAVTKAEQRKMKCVCTDEETASFTERVTPFM